MFNASNILNRCWLWQLQIKLVSDPFNTFLWLSGWGLNDPKFRLTHLIISIQNTAVTQKLIEDEKMLKGSKLSGNR